MPAPHAHTQMVTFFATSFDTQWKAAGYSAADNAGLDPTVPADFLSLVYEQLQSAKQRPGTPMGMPTQAMPDAPHMLVRVPSMQHISWWLQAYFDLHGGRKGRLRVQVVGHSVAGSLSLGASWPGNRDASTSGYNDVFDSNPDALNLFRLPNFGYIAELMLAGCYVGSRVQNINAVNGRTLLFTFAEMWHCKVRGACTSVEKADFDDTGWYVGTKRARPIGWGWWTKTNEKGPTRIPEVPIKLSLDKTPLPTPIAITAGMNRITDATEVKALCAYFDAKLRADTPNLALPELKMTLEYKNAPSQPAALLCNGQFLAVGNGPDRVFYTSSKQTESPEVARLINTLCPPKSIVRPGAAAPQVPVDQPLPATVSPPARASIRSGRASSR